MKEKQKREKRSLRESVNDLLGISPDALPFSTLVEIRAESEVNIAGTKKILLYTPTNIRLKTKKGAISIIGERLVCTSYHPGGVKIEGRIVSLAFEEDCCESV